jgi:hypothetical protein
VRAYTTVTIVNTMEGLLRMPPSINDDVLAAVIAH